VSISKEMAEKIDQYYCYGCRKVRLNSGPMFEKAPTKDDAVTQDTLFHFSQQEAKAYVMKTIGKKVQKAMHRRRKKLPAKVKASIPLPYHKAAFGFVTKKITKEAKHIFGDYHHKKFSRGSKAFVEDQTIIDHIGEYTVVSLYYCVYNSDGYINWPLFCS